MDRTIRGQTVASTRVDSQGEEMTHEDLRRLHASTPQRVPLHQHHDPSLPVCGVMEDFRIIPDPDDPRHLLLVCDVTYDDEKVDGRMGGFSWSALTGEECLAANPDWCVYLPFPLYKDRDLIDRPLKCDPSLAVGRWKKKSAEPVLIVLLVFLAKPLWDSAYKAIEQQVGRLLAALAPVQPEEVEWAFSVEVPIGVYQPRPKVLFVQSPLGLGALAKVPDGLEAAKVFCERDWFDRGKRIERLRMTFDPAIGSYAVLDVHYVDGSHRAFA